MRNNNTPNINAPHINWTVKGYKANPLMDHGNSITFDVSGHILKIAKSSGLIKWDLDRATTTAFNI